MGTIPCPVCDRPCAFTPRPDTQHHGCIRCPEHGFRWIPKPSDDRKPRRKTNSDLIDKIPLARRDFCWNCLRHRDQLKQLQPSVALEIHHIVEVKDGGTDDPINLHRLCAECHAEVHRRREAFGRYRST